MEVLAASVLLTWITISFLTVKASRDFQRTVIFVRVETKLGENVFIRGGKTISIPVEKSMLADALMYGYAFGENISVSTWIVPNTLKVAGSPVVMEDGFGFIDLNKFGSHFWLLDVDLDCSQTERGWFEFKVFVTPHSGWESDILQTPACGGVTTNKAPFAGINHMAVCGKFNMFYYNNGGCIVDNITTALSKTPTHDECGKRNKTHNSLRKRNYEMSGVFNRVVPSVLHQVAAGIASPRIMQGHAAAEGSWPWMAEILYRGRHGCGAVLLSPTWAVTAGHCVRTATPFGVWGLILRVGELDRTSINGKERDYFVKRIVKHPLLDSTNKNKDTDLALVELVYPVRDVPGVGAACLPPTGAADQFVGKDCWGVGWGKTDGNDPRKLQEAKMTVHSQAECENFYGDRVSGHHLCAGGGLVSACSGDSGSPLTCVVGGRWLVAGVVSWGGDNCTGTPTVYTRLAAHRDWIRHITGIEGGAAVIIG